MAHELRNVLPRDLAPRLKVNGKEAPDPFGRAFASRLDGPLLRPTMEITPSIEQKKIAAKNADYFCARGFSHRSKEDYRSALAEYTMALRLDPKHFNSYVNRGVAFEKMNKCENAVADFTKAIEHGDTKMDKAYAFFNRGCCHAMLNKWEAARTDFGQALKVEPMNIHFRYNHAMALRKLELFGVALEDYQLTRALRNDDFRSYFDKTGKHVRNTPQYKKVLGDEAVKMVPDGPKNPMDMKAVARQEEMQAEAFYASERMPPEQQLEELRYILDKPASRRTGEELGVVQQVLQDRGVWSNLEVSSITMLEMLRTMTIIREDPRSYLYHQTQINANLYIILKGRVTLMKDPPNTSVNDESLGNNSIFGNRTIENMTSPDAAETALVEEPTELIVVTSVAVKESIKHHHAEVISENTRFLSSSLLFRHWRKAQLYELASHFVMKTYAANSTIVAQGHKGRGFWMIKSGQCTMTRNLQYSQTKGLPEQEISVALRELWRRDWFGDDCLLYPGEPPEHQETVSTLSPVEVIFLHAEDCQKLIANNKMTLDLLREAAEPPPPDECLLDAYFANKSWAKFKEELQLSMQGTSAADLNILGKFPALPTKPPKGKKPHQTKMHQFMKDHRDFVSIVRH